MDNQISTATAPMAQTKKCSHCGRVLPLEMFNKSSKSQDGLQWWCRDCHAEMNAQRKAAFEASRDALSCKCFNSKGKPQADNPLSQYKPVQLFAELKRRGYVWPPHSIHLKMYVEYDKIEAL